MHGELADHRLAGSGGRSDEDAAALLDGAARLDLEVVEREVELGGELTQRWAAGVPRLATSSLFCLHGSEHPQGLRHDLGVDGQVGERLAVGL